MLKNDHLIVIFLQKGEEDIKSTSSDEGGTLLLHRNQAILNN